MVNDICFFEIPADDIEALKDFYGQLFNWKFERGMEGFNHYHVVGHDSPKGGLTARQDAEHALVNYVRTDSADASLTKAQELGARVIVEKKPVPGVGWYAVVLDPQGNRLGLWQDDPGAA